VQAGQPLRQAQQLCPEAAFAPLDPGATGELRDAVGTALQAVSPAVEVGDEEALCDLSGRHAGFDGEPSWATAVARRLHAVLEVEPPSVGVAGSRFVARMAAQAGAPGRIRRVRPGEEAAFLAPLPLDVLPAREAVTARLAAFGLDCLGAVAALSPADLQRQFGAEGLHLHRLARGDDGEGVHPAAAETPWTERLVLEGASGELEVLLRAVRRCIDSLSERLRAEAVAAEEMTIAFEAEEHEAVSATARSAAPLGSAADAWLLAFGLLRGMQPVAPVAAVRVSLAGLAPAGGRQSDLLRPGDAARESIVRAAGRLRARFGDHTVRRPALAGDPGDVPERRFTWREPAAVAVRR